MAERIKISNDQWVEVRRTNVSDVAFQRRREHERGYVDEVIDFIELLPRVIADWSFGEVTQEGIDTLPEADAVKIYAEAKGVSDPNLLAPSPTGTPAKGTKAASRGNGA